MGCHHGNPVLDCPDARCRSEENTVDALAMYLATRYAVAWTSPTPITPPMPPVSTVAMVGSQLTKLDEDHQVTIRTLHNEIDQLRADLVAATSRSRSRALNEVYEAIDAKYRAANAGEAEYIWGHALAIIRRLASPAELSADSSKDS